VKNVGFVGLAVHAETIAGHSLGLAGKGLASGTDPNRPESVRRLIGRLGDPASLKACYEAAADESRPDGGLCDRSTNNRVINRRHMLPRPLSTCAWPETLGGSPKRSAT
jgi:hypothetical protein